MAPENQSKNLSNIVALYRERYDAHGLVQKNKVWKVISEDYLQQFIKPSDSVLDMGAGTCEFINNIECRRKYAADVNPYAKEYASEDVEVILPKDGKLPEVEDAGINVVFASNFFEHLPNRQSIIDMLAEIRRMLVENGRLIIVQPNITYLTTKYWDYFDHQIALSHNSMREALVTSGFAIEILKARFLPYTFRSRYPKRRLFVKAYLKLPIVQRILGKQMFIVARKS